MQLFQSIFLLRDAIEGKWAERGERNVRKLVWIVKNKNFDPPKRNLSFLTPTLWISIRPKTIITNVLPLILKKKKKIQIPPLSQIWYKIFDKNIGPPQKCSEREKNWTIVEHPISLDHSARLWWNERDHRFRKSVTREMRRAPHSLVEARTRAQRASWAQVMPKIYK